MPISPCATTSKRASQAAANARQHGFTLLEMVAVAFLVGLLMMIMLPQMVRDDSRQTLREEQQRIAALVSQLTEQALFRGDLMALRLEQDRVEPLRYDWQKADFLPFDKGPLSPHELDERVRLEWETVPQPDSQGDVSLEDAARAALEDGKDDRDAAANGGEEERPFPQVFFFPSGEVSPITMRLYLPDGEAEAEFTVTMLGATESASERTDDGEELVP